MKFLVNDVPGFRTKINAIILLFVVGVALLFGIIVLLVSMARGAVIIDREDSKIEVIAYPSASRKCQVYTH